MALSVTESIAVNTLLRWTFRDCDPRSKLPTDQEAMASARLLASHAYKTLSAGYDAQAVEDRWPSLVKERRRS